MQAENIALFLPYCILARIMALEQEPENNYADKVVHLEFYAPNGEPFLGEHIIGNGVDKRSIELMRQDLTIPGYAEDAFTPAEIAYCLKPTASSLVLQRFAARFAAKEALIKALDSNTNISLDWQEIEVCKTQTGKPYIVLSGNALQYAQSLGVSQIFLSLTHEVDAALAWCITVGEPKGKGVPPISLH